jgi:release factor glutamine methyltransferase
LVTIVERLRAAGCVFAEDEAHLLVAAAGSPDELDELVQQRIDGLPLEQVLGWAEFRGLRIAVDAGVFVPRRRTEFLVGEAVALSPARPVVVDLCCGTGAVGAALVAELDEVDLYAIDVEAAAVQCAQRNVPNAHVYQGDLYEPLPAALRGRVDILVANAPYVPTEAIAFLPPEARLYEPLITLDGGADGLDVHRRVAAGATDWLAPDGHLLVEVGERQVDETVAIFARNGLDARVAQDDELTTLVIIGTVRGAPPRAG